MTALSGSVRISVPLMLQIDAARSWSPLPTSMRLVDGVVVERPFEVVIDATRTWLPAVPLQRTAAGVVKVIPAEIQVARTRPADGWGGTTL